MTAIVYVGSFDPFHKGHLEALCETRKLYPGLPTVILPNNPSNSKSTRRSLLSRAHVLGFMFPLYTSLQWLASPAISIDTRPVTQVLKELQDHHLIGIIGSDILLRYRDHPPKWQPQQWVIFERTDFIPTSLPSAFHGVPFEYIPLSQTRYQHISSTLIRQSNDRTFLPRSLQNDIATSYIFDRRTTNSVFETLNRNTFGHKVENGLFVKTFTDANLANIYATNSALWNTIPDNPFLSSKIVQITSQDVYETLISPHRTLFEIISTPDAAFILEAFFIQLNQLHQSMMTRNHWISHGDLSVMNTLYLEDGRFALIDYDKVQLCQTPDEILRDTYQFLSSIEFYCSRYGIAFDLSFWGKLLNRHYTVQSHFSAAIRDHWIMYWQDRRIVPKESYVDEF